MKAKRCAYCGCGFGEEGVKRTAEHIFPKGLLDLYPNEDISFTPERVFIDNSGLTIADVCDKCNNGPLSELDDYGIKLIKNNFFQPIDLDKKDDIQNVIIESNKLLKWLLKISYNYERSRKKECSWFRIVIPYILNDDKINTSFFDIFMGLHINTTPLPEHMYGFMPLEISENPIFYNSSIRYNKIMGIDDNIRIFEIRDVYDSLSIRLGNAVFLVILWDENISNDLKNKTIHSLEKHFNFEHLKNDKINYKLKGITCSTNLLLQYGHFLTNRARKLDELAIQISLHGREISEVRKEFEDSQTPESIKRGQLLVKSSTFPKNKKVKKEYDSFFGEKE